MLAVPLLRDGIAVGAISVGKVEPTLFSDRQIKLLSIFADQALIAIENVRLFEAEQQRTPSYRDAGATNRNVGGVKGHQFLARRARAGVRDHAGKRGTDLRREIWLSVPLRRDAFQSVALFDAPPALAEFVWKRGPFYPACRKQPPSTIADQSRGSQRR